MEKLKPKKMKQQAAIAISKKKRAALKRKDKMSLYEKLIKKKIGISRSKKKSTITDKAYANMQAGFPNSKKNKLKIKAKHKYDT